MSVHDLKFALYKNSLFAGRPSDPVLLEFTEHLTLPLSDDLDRLLRYETSVHRQLVFAVNQLERLQRARKGEHIPAPVTVQISSDQ